MQHASSLELTSDFFNQAQAPQILEAFKNDNNVVRNLGVNFEDLMPSHSGPTSPNFQKMNEIFKSPVFQGKPVSMVLPEYSQNSFIIPLQDHCLETSMPFEDLIGQLESPKLSDKMQAIFNTNVNLSESIMKNTFRAVDESRVKLEDKDLQVELEISELKLHHLEKRVEGCLASSKNTLALNAQLSQNVSKMVSPVKSTQGILTSNIRTRNNSRSNTPRDNIEEPPAPMSSRNEALSKHRPRSVNQRVEGNYQGISQKEDHEFENHDSLRMKDIIEIERQKASVQEKRVKSVSMSMQEPNSRLKDSIINEAYQKLNCYYGPGDLKVKQPEHNQENHQETMENGGAKLTLSHSHTKSTELIMSNNVTFYTNIHDKDAHLDPEEQNKNLTRLQSNDCLSEDQEPILKQNYVFSSKPREISSVPPCEPKINTMPREVTLVDADGKERVFILKPKETLGVERLESIFIIPLGNKNMNITKAKIKSQFSSFQGSETEEASQIKDNLKNIQFDQTLNGNQTISRVSLFDNSNVASMNLDKQEHKLSAFGGQNLQEISPINQIADQKDAYLNNLKLQIFNHPKCKKFFGDDTISGSARGRSVDNNSKESDGMEFYFKQKIHDFREFLNEFEKILPTETSLSPAKEPTRKPKNVQKIKNWEQQGLKEQTPEHNNFESRTVENTPRGFFNENQEQMRGKYNSNMKKATSTSEYFVEQSPLNNKNERSKLVRFDTNEFTPQQLFKENQDSPVSAAKTNFISTKSSFHSNVPLKKKKAQIAKNVGQPQIPSKSIQLVKGHHSIALPPGQYVEKRKTHDKSSSLKSFTLQGKNKKSQGFDNNESVEAIKKRDKNVNRASSKSIVEVVNLGKIPQRANSVVVQK